MAKSEKAGFIALLTLATIGLLMVGACVWRFSPRDVAPAEPVETGQPETTEAQNVAPVEPAETAQPEAQVTPRPETPDPDEGELIEAALVAQGYFREDIPLTFEEQDFLHAAADEFGVDYYIMVALIERETNFRNIPGDGGNSQGYGQIQKKWWAGLMEEIGAEDLTVPRDNFRTACAILATLTDRYGNLTDALTAYNRGKPGESKYASAIMENAEKWRDGNV